jgi:predicted negative regulator of RcsB-dependent stress response
VDIYASDEEKGEEIKQWWRDNGKTVIAFSLLVISAVIGSRYWIALQQTKTEAASATYQMVINAIAEDNKQIAEDKTTELFNTFSATPYAVFSAFEMASMSTNQDDYETAQIYLNWVIEHAELTGHKELAKFRLAQTHIALSNYDAALALLETSTAAFSSLFAELKGDIYVQLEDKQKANVSYQAALSMLKQGEPRQQILKLKLDDTAVSNES